MQLHFTPDDWAHIERDWGAWWAGELDRPLVMIEHIEPPADPAQPFPCRVAAYYGLEMPADDLLDLYEAKLTATRWYGDAFPKWWPDFGPGVTAAFLGAQLHATWDTVWFDVPEPLPLNARPLGRDPTNPWWCRVRTVTERAVARWGDQVAVGYTDLGGNLDILASFRTTQNLLTDLLDAPAEVLRASQGFTQLWLSFFWDLDNILAAGQHGRTPWAALWAPGPCYMLQSDFAYMISPRMFERFVLPDLAACCDAIAYPFYHLDGKGQIPHLDMLLSLERLRGIQWIPGDGAAPAEAWLPLLKRIRDGGKLCQLYVSAQGALEIVRALGGQGFALFINDDLSLEEATAFLAEIERAGRAAR